MPKLGQIGDLILLRIYECWVNVCFVIVRNFSDIN